MRLFLGRSLQTRLIAAFLLLAGLATAVSVFNIFQQRVALERAKAMALRDLEPLAQLRIIQWSFTDLGVAELLLENPNYTEEQLQQFRSMQQHYLTQLQDGLKKLQETIPPELRADADRLVRAWEDFYVSHEERQRITDPVALAPVAQRTSELYQAFQAECGQLAEKLLKDGYAQRDAAIAAYERSRNQNIAFLAGVSLLALVLGWFLARRIRRPVQQVVDALDQLAQGNLTHEVTVRSSDEIGRMAESLRTALRNMRDTVRGVVESSTRLANSANQVAAISQRLAGSASASSERAEAVSTATAAVSANVQTIAASANQMTTSIQEIAKNTAEAAEVGRQAVEVATATTEAMQRLGEASSEIDNVIKMITSIAEQTNLLALNATIEAARAGDAGKGFAVVASEVKDLAQESGRATEEVSRRIERIQSETREAIAAIGNIADYIRRVNDLQNTIASAVEEQATASDEMTRSISQAADGATNISSGIATVADATRATRTDIEAAEKAAAELTALSSDLQRLVTHFRY